MVMAMNRIATPRDRLERIVDYTRKARRYWWAIAGALVLGAVLSVVFAVTRPPKFKSWSVLFYQERIQSNLLSGREGNDQQRHIGERYRELLLSRDLLSQIINDEALNPLPGVDSDEAVEELRKAVALEVRGVNAFRISYTDTKPGRAQAVAARLTELLKAKEDAIRDDQVKATVEFALGQKQVASDELRVSQRALSEFLAKHPEFAQEDAGGSGAGIRARTSRNNQLSTPSSGGNPRLSALERQRARIKARLDAPPGTQVPIVRPPRERSPARIAAEGAVSEAQREVKELERVLAAARQKYTDIHPDVRKAQDNLEAAKARLKSAIAALPDDPDDEPIAVAPTTQEDREKLQKQLEQVEDEIASERRRVANKTGVAPATPDDPVAAVVDLETDYAKLRDAVDEQRDRVETLADSVFRAQIDAQQQLAQQGARLAVVDPAFKPTKPSGAGKTILVMAGLALFGAIGLALAFGLAILDDRLYRRQEVEELGMVPVLAVIPSLARAKAKVKKR
jgi:uncharacterized protein involved in exopolysaccharide biosynthesis